MAIRAPCGAENKVLALKLVIRGNLHHYVDSHTFSHPGLWLHDFMCSKVSNFR
jgi:hypothetical protein